MMPCPCFITGDVSHKMCVFCMGEEHARSVLEGADCAHCEKFNLCKLCSRLILFERNESQVPVDCSSANLVMGLAGRVG